MALFEVAGDSIQRDAAFEAKHPRGPGGRFRSLVDRIVEALQDWLDGDGDGDPFEGFNREQLRKTAKARGIMLKRGASRDEIAELLKADLRKGVKAKELDAPEAPRKSGRAGLYDRLGFTPRQRQIDADIRAAYGRAIAKPSPPDEGPIMQAGRKSGRIPLSDVRDELGDKYSRAEVDEVLRKLARGDGDPGVYIDPQPYQWELRQRHRDAALHMGGTANDMITLDESARTGVDTGPGAHGHGLPGQGPVAKEESIAELELKSVKAKKLEERTFEELLALAKALGRKIPPGATKADLLKLL